MLSKQELKRWVDTLDETDHVCISDNGLSILAITEHGEKTGSYLELGGEPTVTHADAPIYLSLHALAAYGRSLSREELIDAIRECIPSSDHVPNLIGLGLGNCTGGLLNSWEWNSRESMIGTMYGHASFLDIYVSVKDRRL